VHYNLEKDLPAARDKALAIPKDQKGWSLLTETSTRD